MDIKSELLDYINCNENTGALLLTGPWGCGKSFLVKQIAKELNDEKSAAVAVISLFGLDSVSAINKSVKDEYISLKLGTIGNTTRKISKKLSTLIKDGLAVASIASPETTGLSAVSHGLSTALSYDLFSYIDVQNSIGTDDNKRKFVIVFDDLERCGINSNKDLLGSINNFIENKQIKVIIITDEEKINEPDYSEYKEKLISRTLYMSADYESIIENIVHNYKEVSNGYQSFLVDNISLLKSVFFESNTFNIRILKSILADFERVYTAWKESGIATDYMKFALYTFGAEVYSSKAYKKDEESSEKQEFTFFTNEKEEQYPNKGKHHSSFSSIRHWMKFGAWDEEQFTNELKQKYSEKDKTPLYRFLTCMFWDLQQKDIDKGLPQAVSLAYNGELSRDQMVTLIGKIYALKENDITIPVTVDYQRMEKGLDKRLIKIQNGDIEEPKSYMFIEENRVDEEAKNLRKALEKFDNRIAAAKNKEKFKLYINGDDSIPSYSLKHLYFEEFDDDLLCLFEAKYSSSENSARREMALVLLDLSFDYPEYSNAENQRHTKENFEKLINYLKSLNDTDSIAKLINKSFIENVSKKIGTFEND